MKCERCGVELGAYECSRTGEISYVPHRPSQCFRNIAVCVAELEAKLRDAETLIREARIECKLCRGRGYWSTDVYKNQTCRCKAGEVLKAKVEQAQRATAAKLEEARGALRTIAVCDRHNSCVPCRAVAQQALASLDGAAEGGKP